MDRWNAFLNLLLQGGELYTRVTDGDYRVAVFGGDEDGDRLEVVAFTSREEAEKFGLSHDHLAPVALTEFIKVVQVIPLVVGAVINPASEGTVLDREVLLEMGNFLADPHARTIRAGTKICVGGLRSIRRTLSMISHARPQTISRSSACGCVNYMRVTIPAISRWSMLLTVTMLSEADHARL